MTGSLDEAFLRGELEREREANAHLRDALVRIARMCGHVRTMGEAEPLEVWACHCVRETLDALVRGEVEVRLKAESAVLAFELQDLTEMVRRLPE